MVFEKYVLCMCVRKVIYESIQLPPTSKSGVYSTFFVRNIRIESGADPCYATLVRPPQVTSSTSLKRAMAV